MPIERWAPEQIIAMLRQAEIELAAGKAIGEVCGFAGISEQSYHCWRKEYGRMPVAQARRVKDQERESVRLKRRLADLSRATSRRKSRAASSSRHGSGFLAQEFEPPCRAVSYLGCRRLDAGSEQLTQGIEAAG